MRVTVVRPGELGAGEAALWASYQRRSTATAKPFLSLAFARAVDRARPGARVAVVEEGARIEAFLAYELGERHHAVPIGSPMNDLQGFVSSGAPLPAHEIVRKAGLRSWRFAHAPAEQAALAPHHYPRTDVDCPVIDLGAGYDAWFAEVTARGRSVVSKSPKQRRALERQVGPVALQWHRPRLEDLHQLFAWKSGRYDQTAALLADPATMPILEELAASTDEQCAGKLSVLLAGERPIAVDLGLVGPEDLCGWFTGYDPDAGRFSPGTIMLLALAEGAAEHGLRRFDLGWGQHAYKFLLANDAYRLAAGIVWSSALEARLRRSYRQLAFEPLRARRELRRAPAISDRRPSPST